jgi:hypothetical protein
MVSKVSETFRMLEVWKLEKPAEKDGWKAIGDCANFFFIVQYHFTLLEKE